MIPRKPNKRSLVVSFMSGILVTMFIYFMLDPRQNGETLPTVFDVLQTQEKFEFDRNLYAAPENGRQRSLEERKRIETQEEEMTRRHQAYRAVASRDFSRFMGYFVDAGVAPSRMRSLMLNYGYECEPSPKSKDTAIYSCRPNLRQGFVTSKNIQRSFRVKCNFSIKRCESSAASVNEIYPEVGSYDVLLNPYWLYSASPNVRRIFIP
jgi:hypothetical protein